MKRSVLLILVALCGSMLRADDASKRANIEEILTVTKAQGLLLDQQVKMRALVHDMMAKSAPQIVDPAFMDEVEKTTMDAVGSMLQWDQLKPDLIRVYAETFSDDEIKDLLAFYKTPLGQTLVSKLPVLTTKMMEVTQVRVQAQMPQLQERLMEITKKYAAKTAK